MTDRAIVVAALIIGGAIIAASFQSRVRYALSAADNNVAWRMDTWSGQIDICAAAYLPAGPLVRCGALMAVPSPSPAPAPAPTTPGQTPPPPTQPQSL